MKTISQLCSVLLAGAMLATRVAVAQSSADDASLAREVRLETVLRVALAKSPELREAAARTSAALEAAPSVSRLPPPQLSYQLWAAPLARPYALDEAGMHMFGLQQTFPAWGSLSARAASASAQADVSAQSERVRAQELVRRVHRAYAQYVRADSELRLYDDNLALARYTLELARAAYQGARGSQQDVLRATLELTRLHNDRAALEADVGSARVLLNTLMARPIDAALGPPAPRDPARLLARLDAVSKQDVEQRPELAASRSAMRAREKEMDAANAAGRWPEVTVGLQYMLMPMAADPHAYGAMVSVSLPWFTDRFDEEARSASAALAAERGALDGARDAARYEHGAALQSAKAAQSSLAILDHELIPQAQQSLELSQALYRSGQSDARTILDAMRALLDAKVQRLRAWTTLEIALADMERATGAVGAEDSATARAP